MMSLHTRGKARSELQAAGTVSPRLGAHDACSHDLVIYATHAAGCAASAEPPSVHSSFSGLGIWARRSE